MSDDRHRYDDMINLLHHQSASRPHMSGADRAAQFAPFAALTGHGAAILETAQEQMKRITENEQKIQTVSSFFNFPLQILHLLFSTLIDKNVNYIPRKKRKGGNCDVRI